MDSIIAFFKKNGLQILTALASVGVGLALHYGKISADQAALIGSVLAVFGLHLSPLAYSLRDPAAKLVAICVGAVLVSRLVACTPAQGQAAQADVAKIVEDAAACIGQQTEQPNASPEGVAIACGLSATPDVVRLISDVLSAKAAARRPVDAGH